MLDLMDATITIISALTALAAVVLAPLVSIYVVRKEVNAQVISTNRQVWINRLRDELAHFIKDVRHVPSTHAADAITTAEAIARYEDMALREERIKLLLNPTENDHIELLKLIASAREKTQTAINAKKSMANEQDSIANLVVKAAQPVLKREWVRVKNGE